MTAKRSVTRSLFLSALAVAATVAVGWLGLSLWFGQWVVLTPADAAANADLATIIGAAVLLAFAGAFAFLSRGPAWHPRGFAVADSGGAPAAAQPLVAGE